MSGAGRGLVRHAAADKAAARGAARGLVTKSSLEDVAEEAARGNAGPPGKRLSSRVTCRRGRAGRRLSSGVACRCDTESCRAGTDSRVYALCVPRDRGKVSIRPRAWQPWRHRDLAHVFLVLMVWVGGEECLVVRTEANVEESIGADEGDYVDRSCFQVRCWRGSTAEATRLVPVDRTKDRIAEQIVNIPAPRIMEESLADVQFAPHERQILGQAVEGVKVMPQERICDRIAEQFDEHSVQRRIAEQIVDGQCVRY